MSKFKLSRRSLQRLEKAHPHQQQIIKRAITLTSVDFGVGETLRTKARQRILVNKGASWTMNSLHLKQPDGYAHAVDLIAYVGASVRWEESLYVSIGKAMRQAAREYGVPLIWGANVQYGGDWNTVNDMPHFELPRGYTACHELRILHKSEQRAA